MNRRDSSPRRRRGRNRKVRGLSQSVQPARGFSPSVLRPDDHIETTPIAEYHNAPRAPMKPFRI